MNREAAIDHVLSLARFKSEDEFTCDEDIVVEMNEAYDALRALGVAEGELPPPGRRYGITREQESRPVLG